MAIPEYQEKAASFMAEIEKEVGLHDWGDKETVASTLAMLLQSLFKETHVPITPEYTRLTNDDLKYHLVKRLKIQHAIQLHPEVLQIPIKDPLFIIGSGRNGSTLLQHLIAEDSQTRSPLLYEMVTPTNDENLSPEAWHAERVAAGKRFLDEVAVRYPAFPALHSMSAEEAEECTQIIGSDLLIPELVLTSSYIRLFYSQPPVRFLKLFQFHKQAMQLLQFQRPVEHKHWTFKSPFHMTFLPAIRAVYPDAQFVMLHRPLDEVIPSLFSLQFSYTDWKFPDKEAQKKWMAMRGKLITEGQIKMITKVSMDVDQMKKEENPPKVVHSRFPDVTANPAAEIERIYRELGREFTPEFRDRIIAKFNAMNAVRGPKTHHSLENTGVTMEYLKEASKTYHSMFNL